MQRLVDARAQLSALLISRGPASEVHGGAARVGLYRMLQSEYRHLRSRHVNAGEAASDEQLYRWILDELRAADEPAEVAYRGGVRARGELAELREADAGPLRFPADHVLWVSGGTRGIGLLTAEHFVARHGVRKLVLTGRRELPPREQWARHIAAADELGQRLAPLAALVDRGVELEVLSVALDDEAALARNIAAVKQRLGPIGAVVHSAGVTDFENPAFVRKPQADLARVLSPKVSGLDALVRSFAAEPLAFFVLYSSVAAVVPALAVGQSDYAMANAYMDVVAEARPHGLPLVSVQWPSWKDTGMGEARSAAYLASGLEALPDAEGLALLERALTSGARVVLPTLVNPSFEVSRLSARRFEAGAASSPPPRPASAPSRSQPGSAGAPSSARVAAAAEALASWFLDQLAAELRFDRDRLSVSVPVQDYGIDSIMISQLIQTVAKRVEVSVDPSALLEYPTAEEFANYLADEHSEALVRAFGSADADAKLEPPASASPDRSAPAASPPTPAPTPTPTPTPTLKSTWTWGTDAVANGAREGSGREIAVVGMSAKFPSAPTLSAYWELLRTGRSALRPLPTARFGRALGYYAGLIEEQLTFDPNYYLLADTDVAAMDPQALVLLDAVVAAVHEAGYTPGELKGRRVGVYVGGRANHTPDPERLGAARNPVVVTGQNYLAANVSQFFDFRGPSLVVDTACSSPLVAMSMAVQALRAGDIEAAVVGGVSLLADDRAHQVFGQRGLLNSGSRFHVFDRRAEGIILGEGVGVVMLKPLAKAQADGDRVLAVVGGIAVNNDGRTAGPATPNLQAQKAVMEEALAHSGFGPDDVGWIEANGSGSMVTDLLELKAIESIYRKRSREPVALGSIKPNIGHPLAAEGIAAFIKLVLMLHHREQAPFLSGEQPLEHFDLEASPLYFPRAAEPWSSRAPAAGLNCFADGGTNVHVVLGPSPAGYSPSRGPLALPARVPRVVVREGLAQSSDPRSTPIPARITGARPASPPMFWDAYQ
ncbi:Malonyl CoA-acyl carrier protein transacylase [Enhygromyxa salina]|uniref:Malonyl CoA-acyl carrier protein transacylase n=2 Tax=Enhygromyxa salina TaxID=215803 RepID=A0A0C1ZLJ9_9BACT|nr:Malonyl CoA-acyl carrier protein transacylase [Enhygromyxa salina]